MSNYIGDFRVSSTVHLKWSTNSSVGASITRATNGTVRIYKGSSTTERSSAAGITDTEDHDSLTGVHHLSVDLSDDTDAGFYAAGNDYFAVLATATIDGQTVNHPIAQFSIENRSALMPTTTGRKLDVSADGEAGIDLANVGSPTTTLNLSGTTVKTATDVETDTVDIQGRIGSPGVSLTVDLATIDTNIDTLITRIPNTLSLANINAEVDTAFTDYDPPTHAELISEIDAVQSDIAALNNLSTAGVAAAVWNAATASYGSADSYGLLVETNLDAAVSSVGGASAAAIADAVLDEAMSGHLIDGSLGKALADVLVDTNELQIDWVNGGRLDNIIDLLATASSANSILTYVGSTGVVLSTPQMNMVADHVLRRNLATTAAANWGDTISFRSLLGAVRKLVNKVAISGTTLSIYDETDAGTAAGTQAVTSDAAAEPITAVDTN